MYNRRYEKIFIMLRQEQAGFGVGQRAPWGSCILELKNGQGYFNLQVQGLRKLSHEEYAVYLLGGIGAKQKEFPCGKLLVEENGRANLLWEFSPCDMEIDDFVLEDLHTVAIILENKEPICVPMCGYIGEKVEWKKSFLQKSKMQEESKVIPISEPKEVVAKPEDIITPKEMEQLEEKTIQAAESPLIQMENPTYHGNFRSLLEKFKAELSELQAAGIFSTKEMEQISRAGRKQEEPSVLEQEETAEEILEKPNLQEIPEVQYLDLEEVVQLDGIPLSWRNEFFFLLAMKKHRGFLWYAEEWLLGVPATLEDEDMAKFFGFTYFWQPEDKEFGYWMMEMNP